MDNDAVEYRKGLGYADADQWFETPPNFAEREPIEFLDPTRYPDHHKYVKDYIVDKIEFSERRMSDLYDKWRANEITTQAYIDRPDYEQIIRDANEAGDIPEVTNINIPYTYSLAMTRVTYFLQAFFGRRPHFAISAYNSDGVEAARNMEMCLQYQADRTRLIRHARQWYLDGEMYGVGVMRCLWAQDRRDRTVRSMQNGQLVSSTQNKIVFEGNRVECLDPFLFFPDPRVPMNEAPTRGEFIFGRTFEGRHALKMMEGQGKIRYVDYAYEQLPDNYRDNDSERHIRWGERLGDESGDYYTTTPHNQYQVDQGTIYIIPAELGLGESTVPELWLFTILNKSQIVQAEKFEMDHGMHPYVVIEPQTLGYSFGHGSTVGYMSDMQYALSWLFNSHMFNVRAVLNNQLVVNPNALHMEDLVESGPGKIIRLKNAAYGRKINDVISQLNVGDVTRNHLNDMNFITNLGERLSSVSDNLQGIQDSGGRKTATEVRTAFEAGASRLAADARLISAQGMSPLGEMMSLNTQQYMTIEFFYQMTGTKGGEEGFLIKPEHTIGDFYFPISDGTLPVDKVALFQIWQQLFPTLLQTPLGEQYNMGAIFEEIAEIGGVQDMHRFRVQQQPASPANADLNMVGSEQAAEARARGAVPVDLAAMGGDGGAVL